MHHSNLPQNCEARAWKHSLSRLSTVTNRRVYFDLLKQDATDNGIVWPAARNASTSPSTRVYTPFKS